MIAEIGHFALILALVLSLVQGVLPMAGTYLGVRSWADLARPASIAVALCLTLAFGTLAWCFFVSDFSVLNVANNSNSMLPWYYRLAATWGSHEGSILFWVVCLGWWSCAVAFSAKRFPEVTQARVLSVLGLVATGFLLFILTTSDPFLRLFPPAPEGADLNPLLQDPGMIFHPPLLYLGYVGFSVPFAFAIASLLSGRLDIAWARWMRPWTTAAWVFLTVGIALGSYWSYYELGWGGWWAWDPVENSSFMPWLTATALMHSLAVAEKRGCFKIWTVFLAIVTFSLSLLGTFLVRSGVLTSVHAFATDPARGLFILVFLCLVIGLSLVLFAWKAPEVGSGGSFAIVSRESMLLVNNIFLLVAMAAVLLGTIYPLVLDALGLGKISVGAPYFDAVFGPIMMPVVFLMAIGPMTRWKEADPVAICRELWLVLLLSVAAAVAVPLAMGSLKLWPAVGAFLAFWVLFSIIHEARAGSRNASSFLAGLRRQSASWWGMQLAHLGIGVTVFGIAMVMGYQAERDVRMHPGDVVTVRSTTFRFDGVTEQRGPNYLSRRADITLIEGGRETGKLHPEKRDYFSSRGMPMTEASIRHRLTGDVYAALGNPTSDGGWIVRVYAKPFVLFIWIGTLLMALGGIFSICDRRYRRSSRAADAG
ncbi:heme lyase CcmF/NrfE family subunit [Mesosutterella sp. OilRF-GAM-744-9]|uniref:Heme lyase CcmF/NrfE family subunit n=1 Tax=Mesosutterella porci TaxID=2915351 RepID=A0ABS9MSS0_9BURK|nr:heme lyase CcmF/NrfE family subunit [Mesosutterella sp. oilRF-744-WT-GAM-9]MCG5031432.1 heme lyase CcmF/NrfE family subunit [Mesosutterella sp. oilRF-744-WT-GAM-9]